MGGVHGQIDGVKAIFDISVLKNDIFESNNRLDFNREETT